MNSFTWLSWGATAAMSICLLLWWWRNRRGLRSRGDRWIIVSIGGIQFVNLMVYGILLWHSLRQGVLFRNLSFWQSNFVVPHLLTSLTALVVGWLMAFLLLLFLRWFFLSRGKGMMLDGTDVAMLVVGTAVTGWPGFLLMLAAVFALSLVGMIILVLIGKRKMDDRLIITPFIIPATILVLVFLDKLLTLTHLAKIGF